MKEISRKININLNLICGLSANTIITVRVVVIMGAD